MLQSSLILVVEQTAPQLLPILWRMDRYRDETQGETRALARVCRN